MPKPGIKYFAGSFLLSLVAVFVAAKAYLLLTLPEQPDEQLAASIKAKNIELFAVNEEEDPLYNKFKEVSQPNNPLMAEDIETTENTDEVLYAPEENTDDGISADNQTPDNTDNADIALTDGDELEIADAAELPEITSETEAESNNNSDDDNDDDMKIADAAQAPMFTIPLKHNYNIEGGTVTVSDTTDNGKIALASHDVSVYNLGTESQADVTEPLQERSEENEEEIVSEAETSTVQSSELAANVASPQTSDDDPWEVAEVANKHAPKNSLSVKSQQEKADVALPAQETQVAYRPQQNILIPIPDEIMQEENLTPQFSSSKENLQLEEELRSQNKLPPADKDSTGANAGSTTGGKNDASGTSGTSDTSAGATSGTQAPASDGTDGPKIEIRPIPAQIPADDTEKDFDEQNESNADDSTSKSLTDSITAWFSGVKTKAANLTGSGKSDEASSEDEDEAKTAEGKKSGGSIFQKLLGPQEEEKNIAPSELKITFQPNKAEISGQTLEWLRAFADNTVKNDTVVVEIRASQSAPQAIQQKRLKLFYKLLADRGVDYHKINIIFTNREPNSFIIRNVRYASEEDMAKAVVKWGDNPW